VPAPPKAPEVSGEGLREAQRKTGLSLKAELSDSGRLRLVFASRALPLPEGTELRLRADRLGTLLLWPNASDYRVLPLGTLRNVLGERRVDAAPLTLSSPLPRGSGRRLGLETKKVEVETPNAKLTLELAKAPEGLEVGPLLCRLFGELGGLDPRASLCASGEVPVHASYAWASGGGLAFEVTQLARRTDLSSEHFLTPPPSAAHALSGLPGAPEGVFLTREELGALRTAKLEGARPSDPAAPTEGLLAVNRTETLQYLLLDGVPVAAVPPLSERYLLGTQKGRYVRQWRTFLGEKVEAAEAVELPARLLVGPPEPAASAPAGVTGSTGSTAAPPPSEGR
jgi:hypothetical protein